MKLLHIRLGNTKVNAHHYQRSIPRLWTFSSS